MGGEQQVERQRSMGKLPVRERLDLLLDPGIVRGVRPAGRLDGPGPRTTSGATSPPTAWSPGIGTIDGRRVAICAYDFTVLAGSMGDVGEMKTARMRELALRQRIPIVWLLDSAGARIQSSPAARRSPAPARCSASRSTMSGVVPQVAAMLGHCAAGTAYIPALADFVPMVKGTSSMALGGRHLVRAATGEDVTEEEMGGSEVHTKVSGVADLEVASDEECLAVVRRYLSFFPSHNQEAPPDPADVHDPVDRRVEELYKHRADRTPPGLRHDEGHRRPSSTTASSSRSSRPSPATSSPGSARVGGMPVGIVASQPDGARRRARRERGRQGGPLRVAVRRLRHPARVPARRAGVHRRLGGREAGHHPPRRQDAVRGVARRRCRRCRSCCARATAPATS